MINITEGGVTAAKGFYAEATSVGMKENGVNDLVLITSSVPCVCAGAFSGNTVKGAPVRWDAERIQNGQAAQAVVVNSGVANACTGEDGMRHCRMIAETVAEKLVISPESVLMGSTGVIGEPLPIGRILEGLSRLADRQDGTLSAGTRAAHAIMTTDTKDKQVAVNFTLTDGTIATLGGCAKGASMIHPNMCTMLSFLTTDLGISRELLAEALSEDIRETYNMISTDGDTSPNDTVIIMANGLAGNTPIRERDANYQLFREVLHEVNLRLAKMIAGDGIGASVLLSCRILHAPGKEDARSLARAVISSVRVRADLSEHKVYWGRVLCAMGCSGAAFDPDQTDLSIESRAGSLILMRAGKKTGYDEAEAARILAESEITVIADINSGAAEATAWGCDLSGRFPRGLEAGT